MHRWGTRFGSWVKRYGTGNLARDVGVGLYGAPLTPKAVIQWVAGSRAPRPAHALRIVQLAGGRVSLDDIYRQRARTAPHPAP